jgi:Enoyl-CoA hydratase/carnithine racemase
MSVANPVTLPLKGYAARHVRLAVDGKVATITLDRPDKKNPLTFESYAELADLFRAAAKEKSGQGFRHLRRWRQFLFRRDVLEIIAPLPRWRPRSCSTSPA